jgi:hypothetical protein
MASRREQIIAQWSLVISCLALVVSGLTYWQSKRQFRTDYDAAIIVSPGVLPIKRISDGEQKFSLDVSNTAKENVGYFLRVASNMGCVKGNGSKPQLVPCGYESQIIHLSKPEAGSHKYTHDISVNAAAGAVAMPLAYMSDPKYYLSVEVVNASNGKTLFQSLCYYTYIPDEKSFSLHQPVMDTTGESKILQSKCYGLQE